MHTIDTIYLDRNIAALDKAHHLLHNTNPESIDFDMYRAACIKEYDVILEQSGKLLRKVLKPYFHSSKAVDKLAFKDVFRNAALRDLITDEQCERWLQYRDNRNNTAHDYGVNFAEETLVLLPQFIIDAGALAEMIKSQNFE
ncbi:MAG: nucleotidyltransferase substrate binding protein [Saprospiraceae bacterium]